MAARSSSAHVNQLWQMPLLVLSLALFGYAAWLLWDPKPGMTVDQRIAVARSYLDSERPQATVTYLNAILQTEKLTPEQQGKLRLMFAEAFEVYGKQQPANVPLLQARIVEQTRLAMAAGIQPQAKDYRRLARAYELLEKTDDAINFYRRSMAMDTDRSLVLQRKVIDMLLDRGDRATADNDLKDYLKDARLATSEKGWAIQQRAKILSDNSQFAEARSLLDQALKLADDPVDQGVVNYYLGYCEWKLGDNEEAERYLRVCRQMLQVGHPLDGDASYLLGRIYVSKEQPEVANSFFNIVIQSHPDSKVAPLARVGRGVARVMLKEDEGALEDLSSIAKQVDQRPSWDIHRQEVVASLKQASTLLASRANYTGAMELLLDEQLLVPLPGADYFARLANVCERRSDQLEETVASADPVSKLKIIRQVREMRTRAADSYVAFGQKIAVSNDKAQGDALWHGIDLYEKAGNIQAAIAAMESFVAERPEDSASPTGLMRLGKMYQSIGLFDKAIASYQKNQVRYPKSLAAAQSLVPLSQAYVARGPESYGLAEKTLVSVLDNNPLLDPSSEEFKQALFEIGQLYYRTGRYEEAVVRLDEYSKRYTNAPKQGQMLYLMADSYRKSAAQLNSKLATASTSNDLPVDPAELEAARRERVKKARGFYDKLVDMYRDNPPATETEQLYYKLSHFYRADCMYELGEYEEAIKLYDTAAFRFQDDPSALAAYVQIVNCYCKLGKTEEAKAANERAKWLLRRMPADAFNKGSFTMPKEYWEQWLKWANESGMW